MNSFDVLVIGGGASGMMAAGIAAERGKRVLLIEKNAKLGEKLRITGGGRCNVTNAEYDERVLLRHYGVAEKFLYSSFHQFGVQDTFSFFEKRGLPLVVEERKRAFPNTFKAVDVCKVLEDYLATTGVTVQTNAAVQKIHHDSTGITRVVANGVTYTAHSYIFATGGVSHPETGSTGDGFAWLKDLGHTVVAPTPNIVPIAVQDSWVKELAGTSLNDMKITFFEDGNKAFSRRGRLLFTHFGLSGPLILNVSSQVQDLLQSGVVTAHIDMFPDLDVGTLDKQVVRLFSAHAKKAFKNMCKELVPEGTSKGVIVLARTLFDVETKAHAVTKEERKQLVQLLKAMPLTVTGLMGFNKLPRSKADEVLVVK